MFEHLKMNSLRKHIQNFPKKLLSFIVLLHFFACMLVFIFPKKILAQEKLTKDKIYTLTKDEVLAHEENSLGLYQDELGYIVVTADIKKFTRNYHIQGKIYGPFDKRLVEKPVFNLESWGFIDSKDNVSMVIFNGKTIGTHTEPEMPITLKVARKTWAYVVLNTEQNNVTAIINGKKMGPYEELYNYYLSKDGKRWAIAYKNTQDEFYVEFHTGQKIGPYENILFFDFVEDVRLNRWVCLAEKKGQTPKKINGQEVKLFTVISQAGELGEFEEEHTNFPLFNFKKVEIRGANYGLTVVKDQKFYYLANDKLYGEYKNAPVSIDMGEEFNKFNYIVPETKNLYFQGNGLFASNVDKYYVSDSRKTITVIKKANESKDSLIVNGKYFRGVFDKIYGVKFAPNGEEFASIHQKPNAELEIRFSNGRIAEGFNANMNHDQPLLLLGKDAKHWAFKYTDAKTGKVSLWVDGKIRKEEFIGNVALVKEDGKEYFSWFSLEDKSVFLNKLLME